MEKEVLDGDLLDELLGYPKKEFQEMAEEDNTSEIEVSELVNGDSPVKTDAATKVSKSKKDKDLNLVQKNKDKTI